MTVKYKTVITKAGAEKLAAASVPNAKKVNFVAMAVGDGGGKLPEPNASQTRLVNEVWRHALNKISQDKKHKNYVLAELVIPPETGGFWLREMGLYDDTGALIAVGNMAESYKPELAEGSGRAQTLRMVIMVSDIDTVELSIDTTLVMATQDYVDDRLAEHERSRLHPDATLKEKGFTQLSSATDSTSEALAATPNAVKAAYDLAKGKYTAQDATTKQKGIVQLSSATDSVSETVAATPKAVSAAIKALKDTLGDASGKDVVTSLSDFTPGRVPVVGWMGLGSIRDTKIQDENFPSFWRDTSIVKSGITIPYDGSPTVSYLAVDGANQHAYVGRKKAGEAISWVKIYSEFYKPSTRDIFASTESIGAAADLNDYINPGLYYQGANANAVNGKNYPEGSLSGSLAVYKNAGGITQVYRIYSNSRCWSRSLYNGAWSAWVKQYDTVNKPSAEDVDAISASGGGTYQRNIAVKGNGATIALWPLSANQAVYALGKDYTGENAWYVGRGGAGYNVALYNYNGGNGLNLNEDGSIALNLANGKLLTVNGQIVPSVYGNFDARYQAKGSYAAPNTASRAVNGWSQDASTGLIYQWCQGATVSNEANHTVTFPKAFPSACLFVSVGTLNVSNNDNAEQIYHLVSKTTANCVVKPNRAYGSNGNVAPLVWAVGY